MIKNEIRNNKQKEAKTSIVDVEWLGDLVLLLTIFLIIDVVIGTTFSFIPYSGEHYMKASVLIVSAFIYYIAYTMIIHPGRIFNLGNPIIVEEIIKNPTFNKSLDIDEINAIKNRLEDFVKKEKPYLNEELRLVDLAKSINTSTHQLSFVINQEFNQNFYNYINAFRIKEVKNQIKGKDIEMKTILGIAFDSGFNSSASFYRVFKQNTGMTPTQYKNLHRIKELQN